MVAEDNMSISKKIFIAASLVGIIIIACAELGYLSANILVPENNDYVVFSIIFIVALSLLALILVISSIKVVRKEKVEKIHRLLIKQFKNGEDFTYHSSSEIKEIAVFLEGVMNDLHELLQFILIKLQAIDQRGEMLIKDIHQVVADQDNLFSLNAAIESVRSQHDGFSDVYGEIFSLAEFPGRLTNDIHEMAAQLQIDVKDLIVELERMFRRFDPNRVSTPAGADAVQKGKAITAPSGADASK
ncbi:MAG: hypothetical protein FWF12_05950 [Betaproteobacteria bacterium]|nr:hypothetical protein [Betaproteobacteria bacterium]